MRCMRQAFLATLAMVLAVFAAADEARFPLLRAVPDDAFLCVSERYNPEREFLNRYWHEVFEAFSQSGFVADLFEVVGSLLDEQQRAEVERVRQRAVELFGAVDWAQIDRGQMIFVERFPAPSSLSGREPHLGPAHMYFAFESDAAGFTENYGKLVAILEALADEINKLVGAQAIEVIQTEAHGGQVAELNLLAMIPSDRGVQLHLLVARRGNVVMMGLGRELLHDSLELLAQYDAAPDAPGRIPGSLLGNERFRRAFESLPEPEDSLVFFDMQIMLKPFRGLMDIAAAQMRAPGDVYHNTGQNPEASRLNGRALAAYAAGDYEKALELVRQAHQLAADDSIVLYNLACFSALVGRKDEALEWLERAVEAGFYAPRKITQDSDLRSLRDEPRFEAAVERAREKAALVAGRDVVVNASKSGEAYKLCMEAVQAAEQEDYEQSLRLVEQAYAAAPSDSRVLYNLAVAHARLDHDEQALRFLRQAVEGGYYCPAEIGSNAALAELRANPRFGEALDLARQKASQLAMQQSAGEAEVFLGVSRQVIDAVAIIDTIAEVQWTEGYTVHSSAVARLVPDARERPFYRVLADGGSIQDFDRFLPRETESFSVSHAVNVDALYEFILGTIRDTGSRGAQMLDGWADWQQKLGVDVRRDVLDWIGQEITCVTLGDGGGWVWMLAVRDEAAARSKVGELIKHLSENLGELSKDVPMLAMLSVQASPAESPLLEGFEELRFALAPAEPLVWGVTEGRLMIASTPQAMELCLQTARGAHPNIRENPRASAEMLLPEGNCVALSLTDQRRLGDEIAAIIDMVAPMGGMVAMAIPDAKARQVITRLAAALGKLAPVARKIDFFKSAASRTTFDGDAWHTHTVTHYRELAEPAGAIGD